MTDLSGNISGIVFRRTVGTLKGSVSVSGKMLDVLLVLDGQTNLDAVSRKTNLSLSDMRSLLTKLLENGLIEQVHGKVEMIDPSYFSFMAGQLAKIAGPIAPLLVEDAVKHIGEASTNIPLSRAGELIEILGRQVPDEALRAAFIKSMLEKLKTIKTA